MMSNFSCASWPSVCLFWRNIYLGFLHIFWLNCLFVFVVELYELFVYFGNSPLLTTSFANIFCHSVICLLVLFMVSFAVIYLFTFLRLVCQVCGLGFQTCLIHSSSLPPSLQVPSPSPSPPLLFYCFHCNLSLSLPHFESEGGEWKSWLKAQHSGN